MGAVYRAWDTRLNIPLALKEMTAQPGLDLGLLTQLRQQFQQEAAVLARLQHPHLVRVTDFFEEGGNTYLVMDFVEGESLADRILQRGALPEAEVLTWADQLLDALTYCHAQGVLHRDVKPQNVIIRPDGQAILVDFGLVKLWDPHDPQTKTVMRGMGTPEYAPPEQYEADAGHTDPRSDVYSVGATLYHALTGQAPPTATLRMADPSRFVPVRGLMPSVRRESESAVLKAMELPRQQRWQSAQEMAQALRDEPVAPARPVVAPTYEKTKVLPGARQIAPPRKRRTGWIWVVGGLAVLFLCAVILVIGGVAVRQSQLSATARAQAQATNTAQARASATAQQVARVTATARAQATGTREAVQATGIARASRSTATAEAAQATAAAQAQATATAESFLDPTLLRAIGWPLILFDDFGTEANDWTIGDYSDDLIEGSRSIANGTYRWEATAAGGVVWWSTPDVGDISDFLLSVEGRQISGVSDSQYGLIFRRVDRDNYYLFRIRGEGDYQFRTRYEGEWITLISWTPSSLIQPGQMNRLSVVAEGTSFYFYINNQYVDDYTDSKLSSGKVALVIGLNDEGDSGTFEFDNFDVRGP
jgi:serine/threonine-protein kinase